MMVAFPCVKTASPFESPGNSLDISTQHSDGKLSQREECTRDTLSLGAFSGARVVQP